MCSTCYLALAGTKHRSPSRSTEASDSGEDFSEEEQEDECDYCKGIVLVWFLPFMTTLNELAFMFLFFFHTLALPLMCAGGYHPVYIGEMFNNGRYKILHKLGWGHFSTVWMVNDLETGSQAAMKVVKSASHYTEAARDEVMLLSRIKERSIGIDHRCVQLLDSFDHIGPNGRHVCMVFEVLGDNLLSLIRLYNHQGIPLSMVRHITKQVLMALEYLHTKCGIIHTDLKPENVMLAKHLRPGKAPPPVIGPGSAMTKMPAIGTGKLAQAVASGQALTKNQKKRLKKKQQELASKEQQKASEFGAGQRGVGIAPLAVEPPEQVESERPGNPDREHETIAPLDLKKIEQEVLDMSSKVVDFGNACWIDKHFTDDIQTRQYRSPEVNFICKLQFNTLSHCNGHWYLGSTKLQAFVCAAFVFLGRKSHGSSCDVF